MTDTHQSASNGSKNGKKKVLIITGDDLFGERLAKTLKESSYDTFLLKNGNEAMKKIIDTLPHLILLDIIITGGDGYKVLAEKQAEPMLAKIPTFLMSTQGIPINMRMVPEKSVTEFIVSVHANPSEILARVDKYFHVDRTAKKPEEVIIKKKILWVEDDKLIGNILGKKFVTSGFDLVHAKNGEEALRALEGVVPDAIVVDLLLPGMSGFEILQNIKTRNNFKMIPVMVLSNLSKQSDIEKARVLGAHKFLVKAAVSLDQIVAEVLSMFK